MPTAAELKAQADAAQDAAQNALEQARALADAARKAEREELRAKTTAESAAHYTRMYEEIGQPLAGLNEAQHGIVYSQAWEQGHSAGYEEVETYYGEFAEMARRLLEAR